MNSDIVYGSVAEAQLAQACLAKQNAIDAAAEIIWKVKERLPEDHPDRKELERACSLLGWVD